MSQLVPVNKGVNPQVTTTLSSNRIQVLSQQYIIAKDLQERPTEWVPGGRPIYGRLPGASETYRIDFFNIVSAPDTAVAAEIEDIGYVFVPWIQGIYGSNTLEVTASDSRKALLIQSGEIVWKYGKTTVLPTIVDLELIDLASGKYDLSYQLVYDDSPLEKLYQVEDFALTGLPLTIESSTDAFVGWRYTAVNAFLNSSTLMWSSTDSYFPSYVQSTSSPYLRWGSELPMAYSVVRLRCPAGTAYTGAASLSYFGNSTLSPVDTVSIQKDDTGQFFEFAITTPVLQTGWNVEFSSSNVSIQSVEVSGVLTLMEPQAEPSTRAVLVVYPLGTSPKTITNSAGETVPATYCPLATIDTSVDYRVTSIQDQRYVIHRDYVPVANWLTKPFDEDLIDLYSQVSGYSTLWLEPATCMKQEYLTLSEDQITLTV